MAVSVIEKLEYKAYFYLSSGFVGVVYWPSTYYLSHSKYMQKSLSDLKCP